MYNFKSLFLLLYTAHALKVTAAANAAPPRRSHHTLLLCRPIGKVQTCVFIIRQGDHKNVLFSHTFLGKQIKFTANSFRANFGWYSKYISISMSIKYTIRFQ